MGASTLAGDMIIELIRKLETYITSVLHKLALLSELHGFDKNTYSQELLIELCKKSQVDAANFQHLLPNFDHGPRINRASFFEWLFTDNQQCNDNFND